MLKPKFGENMIRDLEPTENSWKIRQTNVLLKFMKVKRKNRK